LAGGAILAPTALENREHHLKMAKDVHIGGVDILLYGSTISSADRLATGRLAA